MAYIHEEDAHDGLGGPLDRPLHARKHKWTRQPVKLPGDNLDRRFLDEVASHARRRVELRQAAQQKAARQGQWTSKQPSRPRVAGARVGSPSYCWRPATPDVPPHRKRNPRSQRWLNNATPDPGNSDVQAHASLRIVESPTSLLISTKEEGVMRVPPRTWLVLENPFSAATGLSDSSAIPSNAQRLLDQSHTTDFPHLDSGADYASEVEDNEDEAQEPGLKAAVLPGGYEAILCTAAGGGSIVSAAGSHLLKLVPSERLRSAAAEANFQRATCGCSQTALNHAALVAGVLNEQDALCRKARDPLDTRHVVRSARGSDAPGAQLYGALSRAGRIKGCVARNALLEEKRAASPEPVVVPRDTFFVAQMDTPDGHAEEEYETADDGWLPGQDDLHTTWLASSPIYQGYDILKNFIHFSTRIHGNIMRTWFLLDPGASMKIGKMQFIRQVLDIGFRENAYAMWKFLDMRHTGIISIQELDPSTAKLFSTFKLLLFHAFGTVTPHDLCGFSASCKLSKEEFNYALTSLGFRGCTSRLFELLDRRRFGVVTISDFAFLDKWNPPPYLRCMPNFMGLQAFKESLKFLFQPIFRAWRKILDHGGTMRITYLDFCTAVKKFQRLHGHTLPEDLRERMPKSNDEVTAAWRALDTACSGWVTLREFDESSFVTFRDFKYLCVEEYGSVSEAFHALHARVGRVGPHEFRRGLHDTRGFAIDVDHLYNSMDLNDSGSLTESEVKFLDSWDIDWEDWEVTAKHRLDLHLKVKSHAQAAYGR